MCGTTQLFKNNSLRECRQQPIEMSIYEYIFPVHYSQKQELKQYLGHNIESKLNPNTYYEASNGTTKPNE